MKLLKGIQRLYYQRIKHMK